MITNINKQLQEVEEENFDQKKTIRNQELIID